MAWYVVGEAGNSLDATPRTLGADLKCVNAKLRFESLGPDVLTWTAMAKDLAASDTILPEPGQVVELWNGNPTAGGTRVFRGHVVSPRIRTRSVNVEVQGPWWWLLRTPVTSDQVDQTGATAERSSYAFPSESVSTMLTSLATRAIAQGVPMAIGTIAASYAIPQATFSLTTIADALAKLMAWIADAVMWFDYSDTSGAGLPKLNISRRDAAMGSGGMAAITYATAPLGGDLDDSDGVSLTPRIDLVTSEVAIHYVTRHATTFKRIYQTQTSGSGGAGTRKIVEVSGPIIDTFLPAEDYQTYSIQTLALALSHGVVPSAAIEAAILPLIQDIVKARTLNSGSPTNADLMLCNGNSLGPYHTASDLSDSPPFTRPTADIAATDANGNPVSLTGQHLLLTDTLPDWVIATGITATQVTLAGEVVYQWNDLNYKSPYSGSDSTPGTTPAWLTQIPFTTGPTDNGYILTGGLYNHAHIVIERLAFSIDCYLTTANYPAATTLYMPQDYTFVTPPAGLADNLRAAQSWLPYDGYLFRKGLGVATGLNLLGNKFNVQGLAWAAAATMAALPKAVEYQLDTLSCRVELGAPARSDYGTLVSSIRQNGQDNIILL